MLFQTIITSAVGTINEANLAQLAVIALLSLGSCILNYYILARYRIGRFWVIVSTLTFIFIFYVLVVCLKTLL
jgi:hypothetical protein